MICPACGKENASDAEYCLYCGQSLHEEIRPRPRLLAQIQGLIPPEPIISTGKPGMGRVPAPPALRKQEKPEPEAEEETREVVVLPPFAAEEEGETPEPVAEEKRGELIVLPPPAAGEPEEAAAPEPAVKEEPGDLIVLPPPAAGEPEEAAAPEPLAEEGAGEIEGRPPSAVEVTEAAVEPEPEAEESKEPPLEPGARRRRGLVILPPPPPKPARSKPEEASRPPAETAPAETPIPLAAPGPQGESEPSTEPPPAPPAEAQPAASEAAVEIPPVSPTVPLTPLAAEALPFPRRSQPDLVPPPPPPPPAAPARSGAATSPVARWLIGALLIAAIVVGLLWPGQNSVEAPQRPAVLAAMQTIDALPAGSKVLLAWDYEPTTQGELQLFALPILRHLQRKQAHIATVSLRPTGPAVARAALAAVQLEGQTLDIGFVPGEEAALQALRSAPFSLAPYPETQIEAQGWQPSDDISQFDLLIEFSAETASTRAWVEQITPRSQIPLLVAASGAVAPALRPYEQSAQIAALLSGYPDALAYEQLLEQEGPASRQRLAQSLAHVLFLIILVLALVRPPGGRL